MKLKSFVKVSPDIRKLRSVQELAIKLNTDQETREDFPSLLKLFDWLLAIPLSNAEAERDFSKLKIIKTRLRNQLGTRNLNNLLQISINGPPLAEFDFVTCAVTFTARKDRLMVPA